MLSLRHATLDTSYHSAVAVQCFMDSVPTLSFFFYRATFVILASHPITLAAREDAGDAQ